MFVSYAAIGNHGRYSKTCTPLMRFWGRVDKKAPGGCWLWTGFVGPDLYGQATVNRKSAAKVHRVSWELANGSIPKGLFVLHRCDVRLCVNPAHLFLGTQRDNMDDMKAKRRHKFGEKNEHAILTDADVREIRRTYWFKGHRSNAVELAAKYGVGKGALVAAAVGRTWRHVK